jgi:hypothetical protein
MTREQAETLRPGQVVYWNDPDKGLASRAYTIASIQHGADDSDPTVIVEPDGSELGCYPDELELV